jgi:hypothetical protein
MAGHATAQRGQVFLDYFDQLGTVRWLCGNAMSFNATTIACFFGCDKPLGKRSVRRVASSRIHPSRVRFRRLLTGEQVRFMMRPSSTYRSMSGANQPETRTRRINNACSMFEGGKRRVCCFDRSGLYSKSLSAPKVAT